MPTIAVVGEVVADAVLPPDGIIDGVAHLTVHPGGGPANTAVALSRLGTTARFAGRLSSGALGALCRAKLEQSNVDLSASVTAVGTCHPGHRPARRRRGCVLRVLHRRNRRLGVDRRLPRPAHRRALPRRQPTGSGSHRHPRPGAAALRPGHREPAGPGTQPTHRLHRPEPADPARSGRELPGVDRSVGGAGRHPALVRGRPRPTLAGQYTGGGRRAPARLRGAAGNRQPGG